MELEQSSFLYNSKSRFDKNLIRLTCRYLPEMTDGEIPHFKVVFLGDSGVGKTSLIERWISDTFVSSTKPSICLDHRKKRIILDIYGPIDIYIWDPAGSDNLNDLWPIYIKGTSVAIIVVAINNRDSIKNIQKWIDIVSDNWTEGDFPKLILAVNKVDLKENEGDDVVNIQEIHEMFNEKFNHGDNIYFVSALSGENVDQLYPAAAKEAIKSGLNNGNNARNESDDIIQRKKCILF